MAGDVAVRKKPLRQCETVRELLVNDAAKRNLAEIAAQHITPERMMKLVANALRTTPKLGECDPMSLLGALMTCASIGLEPNTVLGHAYLVPFRNNRKGVVEVQLIVGYKGLIDLSRRSGHITSIGSNIHYSDDEMWKYEEGTEAQLRHVPGPQEGEKLHAYAIARFRDGGHAFVVLPWAKVIKIRNGSQNWQSALKFGKQAKNPWATHEDAMAQKTAIRALAKFLPMSIEMQNAMEVDEARRDFAALALGRENMIEGTATEADEDPDEDAPEVESEPREDPQESPAPPPEVQNAVATRAGAKDPPPAPPDRPKDNRPAAAPKDVPDDFVALVNQIRSDLGEAKTPGDVEGIAGVFALDVSLLRDNHPDLADELDAEIDAARERVA